MAGWQPKNKRRNYPYFKVQVYTQSSMTWKDERGAFNTVEDAKAHIDKKGVVENSRIIVVEEKNRFILED